MKNIVFILTIFICIGCKAQYDVVPLNRMDNNTTIDTPLPNYYKDLTNELDYYVGTWEYQNGNTSLKIILQKVTQVPTSGNDVRDGLIGEYRYVENGVEIINTLYRLNNSNYNSAQHYISGSRLIPQFLFPECNDCDSLKTRVKLFFTDPGRDWVSASIGSHKFSGD